MAIPKNDTNRSGRYEKENMPLRATLVTVIRSAFDSPANRFFLSNKIKLYKVFFNYISKNFEI